MQFGTQGVDGSRLAVGQASGDGVLAKRYRIVLADDHELVRAGFAALLGTDPEFEVVGHARSGPELLRVVADTQPDLLISDINMPGGDGLACFAQVREQQAAWEELGGAIRIVMEGGRYLSGAVARSLLNAQDDPYDCLTQRQIEVLKLVAQGRSSREIGLLLQLSPKTVDVHRARILERLQLRDIAGLTRYALRKRLIE